jgi:pyruvate-formate lyase-activating enzyme
MLFIFGWGGQSKVLGDGYTLMCPNCHNARSWRVVKTNKKVSLFFVPVVKWDAKYLMVCPVCSAGFELESQVQAQEVLATALQQNAALRAELARRLGSAGD